MRPGLYMCLACSVCSATVCSSVNDHRFYKSSRVALQGQPQQPGSGASALIWQKYEQGEKIGEGTYGWVYHSRSKATGKRVALKQFKAGRDGDGLSHTAIREIMLLRELRHANIVRLDSVHIHRAEPCLWLAFDYADHDLYEMIRFHREHSHNQRLNPYGLMPHHVVKSIMWQLLDGLSYLHQNWVIHRDLKPSNVLVMGGEEGPAEDRGRVRIADFGLARVFQSPLRPLSDNGVVVTIWYRAPELLLGSRHYTRAVDVWAAGCIFAELCALRPLFQGVERKQTGAPFQSDQLDRVFKVLGHPNPKAWPDLAHLPHWHENTDNIRVKKPEYPSAPNPTPVPAGGLAGSGPGAGPGQGGQAGGGGHGEGAGATGTGGGVTAGGDRGGAAGRGQPGGGSTNPAGGAACANAGSSHSSHVLWAAQQLETAVLEAMRSSLPSWLHGSIPSECRPPPEAFRLLAQMLDYNPNTRITAEQALQHEYFTQHAPAPMSNVFYAPGAKDPTIRYTPRALGAHSTTAGSQPPGAGADGTGTTGGGTRPHRSAPGPPAGRVGGVSAAAAAAAAAALGNPQGARKRKAEQIPGFR